MRDRHIVWDILQVGFLFALTLFTGITVLQNNNTEHMLIENDLRGKLIEQQNREILAKLRDGIQTPPKSTLAPANTETTPTPPPALASTRKIYDGSDAPKFVRGDENADDGDTLVLQLVAEPNSLNPLIDNDANASELFGRANDSLVSRYWDDLKYWQPRLATSWEKSMVCRGIAAHKNARALADKLNGVWDAAARQKLSIVKIEAESDEILRIELADVNGDYRDAVVKALGIDAIQSQAWLYVNFEGKSFADGTAIDAASVGGLMEKVVSGTADFTGRFLPQWRREGSVVIQVAGGGDVAEKAIKAYIDSAANTGSLIDPKSATGVKTGPVLKTGLRENYFFEEKPIFTFHLRKDVKWHDDVPFTGKDIVFTHNTIMNPRVEAGPIRNYSQDCESCKLVNDDPYTVQFTWKKPYFLAFNRSASSTALPEHIFKFTDPDEFNKSPKNQTLTGNGAYKFESWDRKQQVVFLRNENYYGAKPHFKKVIYKIVSDTTVALQMHLTGDLDMVDLTKSQADVKQKDPEFLKKSVVDVFVANVYRYIGWNARRPLFKSAKVRRALTMLVDRPRIISDVYHGYGLPMHGPTHPENPNYAPSVEALDPPYNPAEAIKLLNEEGWRDTDGDNVLDKDGQKFQFTLLIRSAKPEYESAAALIKDSFARAGIVVDIANLEFKVLIQKLERNEFDATIMGWQLATDDDPYQLWHSSQTVEKASNHCYFVNAEADRLIELYRQELDENKRRALYQRIQEIIVQEQPYTFLLAEKRAISYDKRIKNVKFKLIGSDESRWFVPSAEQKMK